MSQPAEIMGCQVSPRRQPGEGRGAGQGDGRATGEKDEEGRQSKMEWAKGVAVWATGLW